METKSISPTDQLESLYQENWKSLQERLASAGERTQAPFLISTKRYVDKDRNDESWYTDADLKIMIFGQEPNWWSLVDKQNSAADIMELYQEFYFEYYRIEDNVPYFREKKGDPDKEGVSDGFLTNGCNWLMGELREKLANKMKVAMLWNNISKLARTGDKGNGTPVTQELHKIEMETFHVIPEEISILKPDIVIFLTGPGKNEYYRYICENFTVSEPATKLGEHDIHDACKLNIKEVPLSYKTYHPCATQIDGTKRQGIYEAIVNDIVANLHNN